jgi:RNA polymerase sigma-70 factor (ECF subfamily)
VKTIGKSSNDALSPKNYNKCRENQMQVDTSELLQKIAQQDRKAFELFYKHYSGAVLQFIKKRSYNTTIIEEVVQDIFLNVWKKASYFKPERGNVEQWLFTIARNRLYDYWRKIERFSEDVDIEWTSMEDPKEFTSDTSLLVEKTVHQLPEEYRTIIHMIYIKGHTNKECAEQLKQPEGTIKWKVRKALQDMRNYLEKSEMGGGR